MCHMVTSLIGVEEAAAALGLSRQGVLRRIERGELTPLAKIGKRGTVIFSRDVIAHIAAHEAKRARRRVK